MASAYSYVVNRPSAIPYLMKPRSFNLTLVVTLFLVLLNAMCIILSDQSYLNEKNLKNEGNNVINSKSYNSKQ